MIAGLASATAVALWVWPGLPARPPVAVVGSPETTRSSLGRRAERAVARADLGVVVGDPLRAWALAALVGGLLGFALVGIRGAAVGAALAAGLAPAVLWSRRHALAARIEAELPTQLEHLARQLDSGLTLSQCLATADGSTHSLAHSLGDVGAAIRRGDSVVGAVRRWATLLDSEAARFTAAVLTLGHEGGVGQAHALHAAADTLRDRRQAVLDARALSAQSRVSAMILVSLPVGVAALVVAADPGARQYYGSPTGLAVSGLGLLLDGAGLAWMRRLGRSPQ